MLINHATHYVKNKKKILNKASSGHGLSIVDKFLSFFAGDDCVCVEFDEYKDMAKPNIGMEY